MGETLSENYRNQVRAYRELRMMSKAELARKAGLSALTIDRVEAGRACRLDTKRRILLALGLKVTDRAQLFGDPLGVVRFSLPTDNLEAPMGSL